MIPDAAVESALEVSLRQLGLWGKDLPAGLLEARRDSVRELLEAAAPHMGQPEPVSSAEVIAVAAMIKDAYERGWGAGFRHHKEAAK